jgi:anti-sigma regulatory factor (Ser/Thr protein kinase)
VSLCSVDQNVRADWSDFDAARRMIRRFEAEYDLSDSLLEEVALATSRELYDNAETGNIHTGDMKLAYDW